MTTFTFTGGYPTVYPEISTGHGTLVAIPGETELDFDPGDGQWVSDEPPKDDEDDEADTEPQEPVGDHSPNPALTGETNPAVPTTVSPV